MVSGRLALYSVVLREGRGLNVAAVNREQSGLGA